jgi:Fe(3+) dicitrate transport protein
LTPSRSHLAAAVCALSLAALGARAQQRDLADAGVPLLDGGTEELTNAPVAPREESNDPGPPGSTQVLKGKDLQRFSYDDAAIALTQLPGIYSRGEDGLGLRPNLGIRGVNPDRSKKLTLLEDGIPFAPATYSASAAYYFPLVERMDQLRVTKGPATLAYGPHTIGGAVDLITRPIPRTQEVTLNASGGSFGYVKVHGTYGNDNGVDGFLLEGLHLTTSGFKHLPDGSSTGFFRNEAMFKYRHSFSSGRTNELRLKVSYADEDSHETYLGLSDEDLRKDPDQRYEASALDEMKNHRIAEVLTYELELAPGLRWISDLDRSDFSRTWSKINQFRSGDLFKVTQDPHNPTLQGFYNILHGADTTSDDEKFEIGPNQRDFTSQGLQSTLFWQGTTGVLSHKLEAGFRLHNDYLNRHHSQDAFTQVGGILVHDPTPTQITAVNQPWTVAYATHVMDSINWGRFTLMVALRDELVHARFYNDLFDRAQAVPQGAKATTYTKLLPGASLAFAATPDLTVFVGSYRGFSPPPPDSLPATPELSINSEAGIHMQRGAFTADVVGYYDAYSNFTDVCTLSSGCDNESFELQASLGKARIYGLEVSARHELPLGNSDLLGRVRLPFSLNYSLTKTEFESDQKSFEPIFGSVNVGDELPYVPRHELRATAGVASRVASLDATVLYVSKTREVAGQGDINQTIHTDAQFIVDLSASVNLTSNIQLYATGRNIFDERYIVGRRPFGARPNAPRWIQLGTRIEF